MKLTLIVVMSCFFSAANAHAQYIKDLGGCFGIHDGSQDSWTHSNSQAAGTDWRLVIIDTEAKDTRVNDIRSQYNTENVWVGLRRNPESTREFRWVDGRTLGSFSKWGPGQPNGDGQCVSRGKNGWMDDPCNIGRFAVYEKIGC